MLIPEDKNKNWFSLTLALSTTAPWLFYLLHPCSRPRGRGNLDCAKTYHCLYRKKKIKSRENQSPLLWERVRVRGFNK